MQSTLPKIPSGLESEDSADCRGSGARGTVELCTVWAHTSAGQRRAPWVVGAEVLACCGRCGRDCNVSEPGVELQTRIAPPGPTDDAGLAAA